MLVNIDNYNINYEISKESTSDFDCIIIHGWGTDLYSMRLTTSILAKKYNTYTIDLPGFGKSDKLDKSFTVNDYANIVIHFIEKMGIKNVCLVGHSYGGRIIIKINNKKNLPFDIKQNVFIDAAGIKHKPKKRAKTYIFKLLKIIYMNLPISKEEKEKKLNELKTKFGSTDYRNATALMRDTLVKSVNEDLSEEIKNINRKTLIIWGEEDTDTPLEDALYMKKNISESTLKIIEKAGHFSFLDNPFEYENIIKEYFSINNYK